MRSNIGKRTLGRLSVGLAATVPLLLLIALPAAASTVPSNDNISNAIVITSLPFHDTEALSLATFDPATDSSNCGFIANPQTVWYEFTPATSESVAFDVAFSNGPVAIDAFTGSPSSLTFVACGVGNGSFSSESGNGFVLNATGGTTYWIQASTVCCVTTDTLDLWVYPAVAPQATIGVTGGTVDQAGNATITGTVACTGFIPAGLAGFGTIRQPVGRLRSVVGFFGLSTACGQSVTWSAFAQPDTGRFTGGPATVSVSASGCNMIGCTDPSVTAVIMLRG